MAQQKRGKKTMLIPQGQMSNPAVTDTRVRSWTVCGIVPDEMAEPGQGDQQLNLMGTTGTSWNDAGFTAFFGKRRALDRDDSGAAEHGVPPAISSIASGPVLRSVEPALPNDAEVQAWGLPPVPH